MPYLIHPTYAGTLTDARLESLGKELHGLGLDPTTCRFTPPHGAGYAACEWKKEGVGYVGTTQLPNQITISTRGTPEPGTAQADLVARVMDFFDAPVVLEPNGTTHTRDRFGSPKR